MTKELGVWKAEDCALVLVDYQHEMFEVIRSETNADMVELHARLLAKTAKAFDMPIVPTRTLDGHFCGSLGNVVQLVVEALICARHVARRSIRLAVVELPKQQGEGWLIRHIVFVDVNLQALREVPVEVAQHVRAVLPVHAEALAAQFGDRPVKRDQLTGLCFGLEVSYPRRIEFAFRG